MDKKIGEAFEFEKKFLSDLIKRGVDSDFYKGELIMLLEKAGKHDYKLELGEEFSGPVLDFISENYEVKIERLLMCGATKIKEEIMNRALAQRLKEVREGKRVENPYGLVRVCEEVNDDKVMSELLGVLGIELNEKIKKEIVETLDRVCDKEYLATELIKWLETEANHLPVDEIMPDYFKKAAEVVAKRGGRAAGQVYKALGADGLGEKHEELLLEFLLGFDPKYLQRRLNERQKKKVMARAIKCSGISVRQLLEGSSSRRKISHELKTGRVFGGVPQTILASVKVCQKEGLVKNVIPIVVSSNHLEGVSLSLTEKGKEMLRECFYKIKGAKGAREALTWNCGVLDDYVPEKFLEEAFENVMKYRVKYNLDFKPFSLWVKNPKKYEHIIKKDMKRWPNVVGDGRVKWLMGGVKEVGIDTSILEDALRKERLKSVDGIKKVLKEDGGVLEDYLPKNRLKRVFRKIVWNDRYFVENWKKIVREPEKYEYILEEQMGRWPYEIEYESALKSLGDSAKKAGLNMKILEGAIKAKETTERFAGMDQSLFSEFVSEVPEKQLELQKKFEQVVVEVVKKIFDERYSYNGLDYVLDGVKKVKGFLDYAGGFGVEAEEAKRLYQKLLGRGREMVLACHREDKKELEEKRKKDMKFLREMGF